jgi:peptide deformylase
MEIVRIGNPILRTKAQPVKVVDNQVNDTISQMMEEVLTRNGLGIAAPQIGISLAICITRFPTSTPDCSFVPGEPRVFVNPKILKVSDEVWEEEEGCLSVPKVFSDVCRPYSILVQYQDISLQTFTEEFSGWPARILMHENDHLNGVLFVDRLPNKVKKELRNTIELIRAESKSKKSH